MLKLNLESSSTIHQFLYAGSCSPAWWAEGYVNVCFPVQRARQVQRLRAATQSNPDATQSNPTCKKHCVFTATQAQPRATQSNPKHYVFLLFSKVCNPSATQLGCTWVALGLLWVALGLLVKPNDFYMLGCSGLHLGCSGLHWVAGLSLWTCLAR